MIHTLGENNHEIEPRYEKTPERVFDAPCFLMQSLLHVPHAKLDGQDSSEDHDFCDGDIMAGRGGGQHDSVWQVERHAAEACVLRCFWPAKYALLMELARMM